MLRRVSLFVFLLLTASFTQAQTAPQNQQNQAAASVYGSQPNTQLPPVLSQIEQAARQTNLDLAKLRIEKWKTDGDTKNQASANAQSLMRNLSGALPEMLAGVRSSPNALAPALKLYRDLNAVYDVLASVSESAGAFGARDDYRALAGDSQSLDASRRALGDYLENAAAIKDAQLQDLLARAAAAPKASPPTKTIVDDTEPPKPVTHKKKKATKPAGQSASTPPTSPPPQ